MKKINLGDIRTQVNIVPIFHILMILIEIFLDKYDKEILMALSIVYLINYIIVNRKGFISWFIYFYFIIWACIELLIVYVSISDTSEVIWANKIEYMVLLLIITLILGVLNLIIWGILKIKERRKENK